MGDEQQVARKQFAEEMGLVLQQLGPPRMAGRVLGWMLVSDAPYHTIDGIAEALQASKGSISTTTRLLIQLGLMERVALPGQRRDHFRIKPGNWGALMLGRMNWVTVFRQTLERGLALIGERDASNREPLQELRDLYAFVEREFPALYERWQRERAEAGRQP